MEEQDSFEHYKKRLDETKALQEPQVRIPKHPMNGFMRFHLERIYQQLSKNPTLVFKDLTTQVAEEWKRLDNKKREIYTTQYEFRKKQRERLIEEFNRITKRSRVLTPYTRYLTKMYPIYQKECSDKTAAQINKLIGQEWKKLDQSKKQTYIDESRREKLVKDRLKVLPEHIEAYNESVKAYEDELQQEKEKIIEMYDIKRNSRQEQLEKKRQLKRQKKRDEQLEERRKRAEEKSRKKRQQQETRVKQREEHKQARIEQKSKTKEAKKAVREEELKSRKEEKEKERLQNKEKKQQEREKRAKQAPRKKTEGKDSNKKQSKQSLRGRSKQIHPASKRYAGAVPAVVKQQKSAKKSRHRANNGAAPPPERKGKLLPKKEVRVRDQSLEVKLKINTKTKTRSTSLPKVEPVSKPVPKNQIRSTSADKVLKKETPAIANTKSKKDQCNQTDNYISDSNSESNNELHKSKEWKISRTKQIKKSVSKKPVKRSPIKRESLRAAAEIIDESPPSRSRKSANKLNSSKASEKPVKEKQRLSRSSR